MELLSFADAVKTGFCLLLGGVTCWVLIPLILRWAEHRRRLERAEDFHHRRAVPVVRLGGAALIASFVLVAAAIPCLSPLSDAGTHTLAVLVVGSLAMFALGIWDDLRGLGPRFKFAAQMAIASGVYFAGIKIDVLKDPFTDVEYAFGSLGFVVTVLWLVTLTNLINLIDGIDGLAAGICLMLMCLLANVGMGADSGFSMLLPLGVAGALMGFLRYNYPPAKIHMGDGGAYFLGFLIGTLSIVNSHKGTVVAALIAPAFALALPIADLSLAVLRRGLRGLPVFRPDQKHIHHHLLTLGFSRERTVLFLYTVSSLCLFLAFEVFWLQGRYLPLFSGLLFLILVAAGHMSGFTKDWMALGRQFANTTALRKETRYALALGACLEMTAERVPSLDELWDDYESIVRKLGFCRVELVLPASVHLWQGEELAEGAGVHRIRLEINDGSTMEFAACGRALGESDFRLLADLSAETWHKAAWRWRLSHRPPLPLASVPSLPAYSSPAKPSFYPANHR